MAVNLGDTIKQILRAMPDRRGRAPSVAFFPGAGGNFQAVAIYAGGSEVDTYKQAAGSTPEGAALALLAEVGDVARPVFRVYQNDEMIYDGFDYDLARRLAKRRGLNVYERNNGTERLVDKE